MVDHVVPCGMICIGLLIGGRRWFSAPPVNAFAYYVLATICHAAFYMVLLFSPLCQHGDSFHGNLVRRLHSFFHNVCRGFIICMQVQRLGGCIKCGPLVVVVTSLLISILVVRATCQFRR